MQSEDERCAEAARFMRLHTAFLSGDLEALRAGVEKVSFIDGRVAHSVLLEIFTDEGVCTEVVL